MACAALKRPHNFDLLASSPEQISGSASKRRCGAVASSVSPSVSISPFKEATPKVSRDELSKCVHEEWRRIHRRRKLSSPPSPPSNIHTHVSQQVHGMFSRSSFWNSAPSSYSAAMSPPHGSSSSGNMSPTHGSSSPSGSMSPPRGKEQASLTIKQVVLLCERLWKEREEKLCEDYDRILNEKLGEQYESFLKFTQDQIIRKYQQSSCSYVS